MSFLIEIWFSFPDDVDIGGVVVKKESVELADLFTFFELLCSAVIGDQSTSISFVDNLSSLK